MAVGIPIKRNILPWTASNRPGYQLNAGPLRITVHETGNESPGADADNQIAYLHTADARARQASYHLTVDQDSAAQGIPLDEIAWHAGDGCDNRVTDLGCYASVAIEKCVNAGANEDRTNRNLAELIARICAGDPSLDWGSGATRGRFSIDRIDQHYWVSDDGPDKHDCPQHLRHMAAPLNWDTLMRYVDEAWAVWGVSAPPAPVYATPKPIAGAVKTRKLGGSLFIAAPQTVTLTRAATPRQFAGVTEKPTGPDLKAGDAVAVDYVVKASDGNLWFVTRNGARIPAEAVA